MTFIYGTTVNNILFEGDSKSRVLAELNKFLVSESNQRPASIRSLIQFLLNENELGTLPVALSNEEVLRMQDAIEGRRDALDYLQPEQRRQYFAIAIAYDCYQLTSQDRHHQPEQLGMSLQQLADTLGFVLLWLHDSIKAYVDFGIESRRLTELRSIPEKLRQEAFQKILKTIERDTQSKSAAREAKRMLNILSEKILQP